MKVVVVNNLPMMPLSMGDMLLYISLLQFLGIISSDAAIKLCIVNKYLTDYILFTASSKAL